MSELKKWFNISSSGNFEHGLNMVSLNKEYSQDFFQKENWEMICQVRKALLKERQNRIPPLTDTKAQASWNFHLLSSLADVAQFVPWPEIREKALNLLKTSWTKCLEQFVDLKNFHISHVSTLDKTPHYFEDNQNFLEATLRYYEITGDQSCREILLPWWNHISENFILENKIYTRNISDKNQPYPNLPQKYFDHSYRSPASSFIGNSLRLAVLLAENHIQERVLPLIDECTQMCLANPLSSGESLRYLTYPRDIFKKIEVPQSFLQDDQFLRLRAHLPQRFVLDYHQRDQDSWQICSLSTCEKQGKGVRELFEKLSGSNQQNLNPNMKNENNFTKAQDKGEK